MASVSKAKKVIAYGTGFKMIESVNSRPDVQSKGNFELIVKDDQVEMEVKFDHDEEGGFQQTIKLSLDAKEAREIACGLFAFAINGGPSATSGGTTNCPFYGHAMYQTGLIGGPRPILLLNTNGNQCAVVVTAHTPCRMEMDGETPDWKTCPLVREMRMETYPDYKAETDPDYKAELSEE